MFSEGFIAGLLFAVLIFCARHVYRQPAPPVFSDKTLALLKQNEELSDVLKQWGNPCVREAHEEYQRRRWHGRV